MKKSTPALAVMVSWFIAFAHADSIPSDPNEWFNGPYARLTSRIGRDFNYSKRVQVGSSQDCKYYRDYEYRITVRDELALIFDHFGISSTYNQLNDDICTDIIQSIDQFYNGHLDKFFSINESMNLNAKVHKARVFY